jgi:HKD family nuclease
MKGLKLTEILEARVKVTVQKTRKTYFRTMNYAKHVAIGSEKENIHKYYLREGRKWREASEEEYKQATSKEAVKRLHEKLSQDLRKRVEADIEGRN